jgi:phosphatidylinositol glycan class B
MSSRRSYQVGCGVSRAGSKPAAAGSVILRSDAVFRRGSLRAVWKDTLLRALDKRAYWALLFISHVSAVIFSRGYFQYDEHYQVLEFIQWKLGLVHTSDMPWELRAQMRPWLHPLLFFPLEWFSLHALDWSPFVRTTLHRACVATLALFVIARRCRLQPALLPFYACLFYFPFLDARMSAEVIGGWLFALAFTLDQERDPEPRPAWSFGCGVLFGLAAVIRFQVFVLVFGLLAFHLLERKLVRCLWLGLGMSLALALGILCDLWGYGTFVLVPWNYFNENILLGKSLRFGSGALPWYWYLVALLEKTYYLPGAVMLAALVWQWLRRPLSKLTFISMPFVLLHCAVAHKELRFLFSLAPFMPDMLWGLWQELRAYRVTSFLAAAFIAFNLTLLVPAALHDADADVGLYAALYSFPPARNNTLYYKNNTNPLGPWGLNPSYYLSSLNLKARPLRTARKPAHGLIMFDRMPAYAAQRQEGRCELLAARYPSVVLDHWPSWMPDRGPWIKLWSLWNCP